MPITNYPYEVWETYCNFWRQSGCTGVESGHTYTSDWYVKGNVAKLDPEHRPYPENPIKSMTPRETQWTSRRQRVQFKPYIEAESWDWSCSPWKKNKVYYDVRPNWPRRQDTAVSDALSDYPDWVTPLSVKIADEAINLGATVAEYKQSVNMFGSAAKGVVEAFRSFRRLKFRRRRSMCSVTAAHLIHDYGVAPLLSDLYDSYEALRLRLERPVFRHYYIAKQNPTVKLSEPLNYNNDCQGTRFTDIDTSIRVNAYVEVKPRDVLGMFTLGNPLSIAWELVPYSFVVDWMIPIGDTLIALDAHKDIESINISVTRKFEQYDFHDLTLTDVYGATHAPIRDGWHHYYGNDRLVYNYLPLPPLPTFDFNASISKLLNAASLLVSARGCKGLMPRYTRKEFGL